MERPVAFASRALLENERKYSVGERETLRASGRVSDGTHICMVVLSF